MLVFFFNNFFFSSYCNQSRHRRSVILDAVSTPSSLMVCISISSIVSTSPSLMGKSISDTVSVWCIMASSNCYSYILCHLSDYQMLISMDDLSHMCHSLISVGGGWSFSSNQHPFLKLENSLMSSNDLGRTRQKSTVQYISCFSTSFPEANAENQCIVVEFFLLFMLKCAKT